jgi:hypothetical protein
VRFDSRQFGNLTNLEKKFFRNVYVHGQPRERGTGLPFPVNGALEHLARLESQNAPRGNLDFVASLGIPATTGRLFLDDEITETSDFDLLAILQGRLDQIENGFDDFGGFLLGKSGFQVNIFDKVRLGHGSITSKSVQVPEFTGFYNTGKNPWQPLF